MCSKRLFNLTESIWQRVQFGLFRHNSDQNINYLCDIVLCPHLALIRYVVVNGINMINSIMKLNFPFIIILILCYDAIYITNSPCLYQPVNFTESQLGDR